MKISVRAHEIATLLDRAPEGVATLSLDCFDTLLWRNVHSPRDVFAGIDLPGGGLQPRAWAEAAAHRVNRAGKAAGEISIEAIYERLLPNATIEARAAAVEHELALEARHCFPFAPVVELMRDAKARGLQVIVVSDTYLSEAQLRGLIANAAGDDVLALIDRVFASSAFGRQKAHGLFDDVLAAIGAAPETILHLGDNPTADLEGAHAHGINAVQLVQFDRETRRRLRLEAGAGTMINPAVRHTLPVYQPHRPALSLRTEEDAAWTIGHDVLGPVMHAFAEWLKAEIDAMAAATGKTVRPLFAMRDGYLPLRAFEALYPDSGARPIELSRYAATRATLTDGDTIQAFLAQHVADQPIEALARQIGLFKHEIAPILRRVTGDHQKDSAAFLRAMRAPDMVRRLTARSAKYRARLLAHLKAAGVEQGDTVMLVDIGYQGSIQNVVTPMLADAMGLTIAGRYLFLREEAISGLDKKGLLGTEHFDCRALHAMSTCVVVIEQMCNIAQGSTVDYQEDGTPIRESAGAKSAQTAIRDRIQEACVAYARTADAGLHRRATSDDIESRRQMAAATLARLLFLPLESEVALFEQFDHDVNLGSDEMLKLLDRDEAAAGLRRRGLSYVGETRRWYVPAELAAHGLPLNLSLFGTMRFAMELRDDDFQVGAVTIPVIMADATNQAVVDFEAVPTAEGFYRINVPVGAGKFTAAIQFGALCEWVQIGEAHFVAMDQLDQQWRADTLAAPTLADGMRAVAEGMYEAEPHGVLVAPAPKASAPMVLSVIFRPLKWRREAIAARAAA